MSGYCNHSDIFGYVNRFNRCEKSEVDSGYLLFLMRYYPIPLRTKWEGRFEFDEWKIGQLLTSKHIKRLLQRCFDNGLPLARLAWWMR
ncbi:Uncharacterized protein ChrSV_0909 [Chromobacterium vaccinii]|nr:Uncharacterized protein ChrSW_0909 [Chromobacterium vaccinii]QND88368.1 Uncharacterized protein ChrSV_0909 [Chromobacterium vaccinii]